MPSFSLEASLANINPAYSKPFCKYPIVICIVSMLYSIGQHDTISFDNTT
jgi:hypothetical protein